MTLIALASTVDTVTSGLAVLVVAAQVAALVLFGALLIARRSPTGPAGRLLDQVGGSAVSLAWLVAATAMIGSLYFQYGARYEPCHLCWYQRIAMYSLAVILGIAALRRDAGIWVYAVPVSVLGAGISIYHYQLERFPNQKKLSCEATNPCTTIWFEQFGYITISMMALSGFALITALLLVARRTHRTETHQPLSDEDG